jgi:hypothetical protein
MLRCRFAVTFANVAGGFVVRVRRNQFVCAHV